MGELNSDVCIRDLNMLWQNGIIPYEFNNKVINNLRQYVEITMKEISKVSSIRFVKRTDQLHFIEIVDKGEYWSSVGKQGGNQELSVTTGWQNPVGSAIHELLHSCGMFHEHSRPVKDKYVVVRRNGDFNYEKLKSSNVKCYSKYDFESIMHHPLTLCMDVKPGVKKQNSKIGQPVKLSKGIKAINKHAFPHKREEREDKHFKMPEKKFSPCDAERRSKEKKNNFD